jgi:hydrogenase maturation protease
LKTLVIGVGNAQRGDDAAGLHVVQLLRKVTHGITFLELSGEGAGLIDAWQGTEHLFIIDAAHSGAVPGTIARFDASIDKLPHDLVWSSTHTFGVGEAVELSRVLKQLPKQVIVYAIEGRCFDTGVALAPEVERGVQAAAAQIARELSS